MKTKTKSENDLLNHNQFTKVVENVVEKTIECFIYGCVASLHSNWVLIIDNEKCITLREIKLFVINDIQTYHSDCIKQMMKNQMINDDGVFLEKTIKNTIQKFITMKKIVLITEYDKEVLYDILDYTVENLIEPKIEPETQQNNSNKQYCFRFCNCFTKKK